MRAPENGLDTGSIFTGRQFEMVPPTVHAIRGDIQADRGTLMVTAAGNIGRTAGCTDWHLA